MVKKVGTLKVVHDKFKRKSKTEEEIEFKESFKTAVQLDPTLKHHVGKAQDDLNPLVVINLLELIADEVDY